MHIEAISESNITGVWNLYQGSVAEHDRLDLDAFRFQTLQDPGFDPELAVVAIEDGCIVSFLMAVCRDTKDGRVGYIKLVATDESCRFNHFATNLLQTIEARLAERGVARIGVGFCPPNYMWAGIDPQSYTAAVAFLIRRGYSYKAMHYNMDIVLDGRDFSYEIKAPGVSIRRVEASDVETVGAWVEQNWNRNWRYEFTSACRHTPARAFIAEKDGELAGFAVYDAVRPGIFGPEGVGENVRSGGIGSSLFKACLTDMQEIGHHVCRVGAVGPLYFYWRIADAQVSQVFWYMEKNLG